MTTADLAAISPMTKNDLMEQGTLDRVVAIAKQGIDAAANAAAAGAIQ